MASRHQQVGYHSPLWSWMCLVRGGLRLRL